MQCVVAGFDPFEGATVNPSQEAVKLVSGNLGAEQSGLKLDIKRVVLPTCCSQAWDVLHNQVEGRNQEKDFIVILSGAAGTRSAISLERYALNVRHYRIADNQGHQPKEEPIDAKGLDAVKTNVDLLSLVKVLTKRKINSEISHHAGTFVCNEIYYRALSSWGQHKNCKGILFVHLPHFEKYDNALRNPDHPLVIYTRTLEETIRFICQQNTK